MLWAAKTASDRFDDKVKGIASGIEQAVSSTSSEASSSETSEISSSTVESSETAASTGSAW